ncbi:O-antigen ligase family protein [Methylorubrum extorquens]
MAYRADSRLAYRMAWLFPGSLIAPSSLTIIVGALTLPRIALCIASVWTVREMWRKLTMGGYVPIASDLLVPFTAAWMLVTLGIHEGTKGLVGYGAVAAIEFALAYFLARVFFGTPTGFQQMVRVLRFVTAILVVTAFLDTVSGQHLAWAIGRGISRALDLARQAPQDDIIVKRFGLVRAQGSLEHPILFGVFFVVCIQIIGFSALRTIEKTFWIGICLLGLILPLSSAPLLSLVISIVTVLFLRAFDRFPWRMLVLVAAAVFALVALFLIVDDPLTTLIQNLTYDPQTGLFRVLIWQWVGLNVERAPWLGIGFADWMRSEEMPSSIDSLYLIQAIRHGLPSLVLLVLSLLSTGVTMPLRPQIRYDSKRIAALRQGLAITIFIVLFNAFTVHFWGAIWTLLAIVLGARAGLTESVYLHPLARDDEPPRTAVSGSVEGSLRLKRTLRRAIPG